MHIESPSRSGKGQFARFVFAGGIGLIVNLGITYAFTEYVHLWYFLSFCIGIFVSWTCSFLLNAFFTFEIRPRSVHTWANTYLTYVLGYLAFFWINAGVVYVSTSVLGFHYLISIIVSAVLTTAGTFAMSRSIIFSSNTHEQRYKAYTPVLLLALLIGCISVAPQLYAQYHVPGYSGIAMMGTDAEEHYAARIQEVRDGYPSQGNVFLPDKNIPALEPGLGEDIVAYSAEALHLTTPQMIIVGKFVFPFLIALLLYELVYILTRRRISAGLSVVFVMWGDSLLSGSRPLLDLVGGVSLTTGFLTFSRPVNPEISALFLFGVLLMLSLLYLEDKRLQRPGIRRVLLISTGLATALSLYVSFYTYLFLLTFGFFLCVYRLLQRAYHDVGELVIAGSIALLGAVPFVLNYVHAATSPQYADTALRFGLMTTRSPVLSLWVLILILGGCMFPLSIKQVKVFILTAACALIVVLNQQVITGHALQSGHFHWYITKPIVGIFLGISIVLLTERFIRHQWLRRGVYGLAATVLLYNALLVQLVSYRTALPATRAAQAYAPVLSYLHSAASRETVWADRTLSTYIPLYTTDDAPNNDYALYYLVSNEYLLKRVLVEYKLEGVEPQNILNTLRHDRGDVSGRLFGVHWRETAGSYAAIPDTLLESYAQEYMAVYQTPTATLLTQLGITKIVWDTTAEPTWHLNRVAGLYKEATLGTYIIYHL